MAKQSYKPVEAFILQAIDNSGYDAQPLNSDKEKLQFLADTFKNEYGWSIPRYGIQSAIREWLQGLPSAINLPFYNVDILHYAWLWGSLGHNPSAKDKNKYQEKEENKLLSNYWQFMAMRILSLFKRNGIEV